MNYYDNLSEEDQLELVKKQGIAIHFIKTPSKQVQLEAIKQDPIILNDINFYIKNPCQEVLDLKHHKTTYYNNLSKEEQLEFVKKDGAVFQYIKNPSEEVQLEAVKQNGHAIQYIENPSEKVQLEAVIEYGWVIQHIKNPTKEVQLEAIKRVPMILDYIKECIKNPCQEVLDLLMIKDIIE